MPTNSESRINMDDILIVDDQIPNLQILSELLGRDGYQVRAAKIPQMAIDSALAQPPRLILLDVKMPELDGFEVCRRLKQDERTRGIPIIFISALQDVQDRVRGFKAGGVDFISKPFQASEVLARVRTHMDLRNMQLNLEEIVSERTSELSENESRFRGTFEQAAVGIAHVSLDGHFLRINKKFCDIVGYSQDEMHDLTFQEITHPDDLEADLEYVRQVLSREIENYSMEKRYYRKDGSVVWINLTVSLLFDGKGSPRYFVAVVQDISERRQAMERIRYEQEAFRSLADNLPDVVARFDRDLRHIYINPQIERATGRPATEYLGKRNEELGNPKELCEQWNEAINGVFDTGEVATIDFAFLGSDRMEYVESRIVPEFDASGAVQTVIGINRIVTERKIAEDKLRESEEKYRGLVDNSLVGVFSTTLDGRFTFVNEAIVRMYDFGNAEQMLTKGSLARWADLKQREQMLAELKKHGSVTNFGAETITHTGRHIHVLFSAKLQADSISGMVMDISDRTLIEDTLYFVSQKGWEKQGDVFLESLAGYLSMILNVEYVFIAELKNKEVAQTIALYAMGETVANIEYNLDQTPCENVMNGPLCFYEKDIQAKFPHDKLLAEMNAESYVGIPLSDSRNQTIGLIALVGCSPIKDKTLCESILQIVAVRASAELERRITGMELQKSEEKFRALVTNTEEIVYMIDKDGTFLLSEGKGLSKLGLEAGDVVGKSVFELYKDFPAMLDKMRQAFNGETVIAEFELGDNYFKNWYTPQSNQKGEIIGLLGLSINITERKL